MTIFISLVIRIHSPYLIFAIENMDTNQTKISTIQQVKSNLLKLLQKIYYIDTRTKQVN